MSKCANRSIVTVEKRKSAVTSLPQIISTEVSVDYCHIRDAI